MRWLLALALLAAPQSGGNEALVVVRGSTPEHVIVQAVVAPRFGFRIERGAAPAAGPLRCRQRSEQRTTAGVSYPVVLLECQGGLRLVLTDVDLTSR